MKNLTLIVTSLALVGTAACQQDNKELEAKLDKVSKDMAELKTMIQNMPAGAAAGAAGQRPQRKPRPEPKPTDVFAVNVDGDPADGPDDALVTIVKGYEYACPFCDKVRPTLDQLKQEYGGKIRIVYKQFVVHPQAATDPALAVCAAHKQGKFLKYDKLVWEKAYAAGRDFSMPKLEALATEAGLDLAKFKADVAGDCKAFIAKDQADLQIMGQGATPTFYINGRYMSGAQPVDKFKAIIDEELGKAEQRVAQGTPKSQYYKTWVIDKGLKKFDPPQEGAPAVKQPAAAAQPGGQVIQVKPAEKGN
jgi:protein-disulfide isomerase